MKNLTTKLDGNILTITVDLAKRQGRSKSGKTEIIASSEGNVPVSNPKNERIYLGLNVYAS